jgi:hypothetical protein
MTVWFQILLGNVNSPRVCSLGRSYIPGVTGNPNLWEDHDIRDIIAGFLDQSRSLFDTLLQVTHSDSAWTAAARTVLVVGSDLVWG